MFFRGGACSFLLAILRKNMYISLRLHIKYGINPSIVARVRPFLLQDEGGMGEMARWFYGGIGMTFISMRMGRSFGYGLLKQGGIIRNSSRKCEDFGKTRPENVMKVLKTRPENVMNREKLVRKM